MALSIDAMKPFMTPSSRRALVEAVRDAPATESEPDWLEWKSIVDLREKRWQAEIARHILGFANRPPEKAMRAAGGFAYLLLGVEPSNLCGVEPIDHAALEAAVVTYTGHDGPQWSPEYVDVEGVSVLVITVAPPQDGDRMYAFEKEFQYTERGTGRSTHYQNGRIFVRREGRTEPATASEIRMLERRRAAGTTVAPPTLDVVVSHWGDCEPVRPVDLRDHSTAEWLNDERKALARPPDTPQPARKGTASPEIARLERLLGPSFLKMQPQLLPEDRDPEKYDASVERYLASAEAATASLAAYRAVCVRIGMLGLAIENRTAHNFVGVVAEVYFAGSVRAFIDESEADDEVCEARVVDRPRPWGPRKKQPLGLHTYGHSVAHLSPFQHQLGRTPTIDNSGSARIRFPAVDLRPEHVVRLDNVHLVVERSEDSELVGEWTATATSVSGVARGEIRVPLGRPLTLRELFALPVPEPEA